MPLPVAFLFKNKEMFLLKIMKNLYWWFCGHLPPGTPSVATCTLDEIIGGIILETRKEFLNKILYFISCSYNLPSERAKVSQGRTREIMPAKGSLQMFQLSYKNKNNNNNKPIKSFINLLHWGTKHFLSKFQNQRDKKGSPPPTVHEILSDRWRKHHQESWKAKAKRRYSSKSYAGYWSRFRGIGNSAEIKHNKANETNKTRF